MKSAPIPPDESTRLEALRQLDILDTEFEPAYDAIVELASVLCDTPVANFTLIDRDRQWNKASKGMGRETSRDVAFCAHTILSEEPLVVENATIDPRFSENPLVIGDPYIRFYAGERLTTPSGHAVGSLCVIDTKPRTLTEAQRNGLRALARQASALLELRLRSIQLRKEVEERRAAEAAAEDARARAEDASRAKSEFLARMSHELRTPLNSVIGFANVLGKNKKQRLDSTELDYVERIERNGRHLLSIVNDLLDLAKVNAGKMSVELERVDLATMVRETVSELEGQILDKPVKLSVDIPSNMLPLLTDRAKLKQSLINLAGNAIKFTDDGVVTIRVTSDELTNRPTIIEVCDEAGGIPPDKLPKIFDAFEQADSTNARAHDGTGLGLAITKAFVELLGYRLELDSEFGKGTTARIFLE
jgi:signal transduction histidine kinase